jgi:hypothetical protein
MFKRKSKEEELEEEYTYVKEKFFDGHIGRKYIQVRLDSMLLHNETLERIDKELGYEPLSFGGGGIIATVKYLFKKTKN